MPGLRPEAANAPASGIVEVFNYGRGRPGLVPLWVGEGDLPTPSFVGDSAAASLAAGETFYTYQLGLPSLRETLAAYLTRLYGTPVGSERVFVTGSGMHAIVVALQLTVGAGDEVVVPTPVWPNVRGAAEVLGARAVEVAQRFSPAGWSLDLDAVRDACGPRTKAIFVNTPANPTGWTATPDEISALLGLARERGLWLIADEIYARFSFSGPQRPSEFGLRAPSFFDAAAPEDRVLYVNSFSKNWAMTGWRVGWLVGPPEIAPVVENLVQYSSSGVPTFVQRAAQRAVEAGEPFVRTQLARAERGRALVTSALGGLDGTRFAPPDGAFYLFFALGGVSDDRALALRLVDEANVGLAPGSAFGAGGAGFLRLCFLRGHDDLALATKRLIDRA